MEQQAPVDLVQERMNMQRLQSIHDDAKATADQGSVGHVADLTRFSEASANALAGMPGGSDLSMQNCLMNNMSTPMTALNPSNAMLPVSLAAMAPGGSMGSSAQNFAGGGIDLIPALDMNVNPPTYNVNIDGNPLTRACDKPMDPWEAQQRQLSSLANLQPQQQQNLLAQLQIQLQNQQQELKKIEQLRNQHQQQQIATSAQPLVGSISSGGASSSTSPTEITEAQIQREIAHALQPHQQVQAAPPAYSEQLLASGATNTNEPLPMLMFPTNYHLRRKGDKAQAQNANVDQKNVSMPSLGGNGIEMRGSGAQTDAMQAQLRAQASAFLNGQPAVGASQAHPQGAGLAPGMNPENNNLRHQFSMHSQDTPRNTNLLASSLSCQSTLTSTMGKVSLDGDGLSSGSNSANSGFSKDSAFKSREAFSTSESDNGSGQGGAAHSSLSHSANDNRKPYSRSESISSQSSQSSAAKSTSGNGRNSLSGKNSIDSGAELPESIEHGKSPKSASESQTPEQKASTAYGVSAPTGYLTTRAQAMAAAKEAVLLDVLDAKQKAKVIERQQSMDNRISNNTTPASTPKSGSEGSGVGLENTTSSQDLMDTSGNGDGVDMQESLSRASTLGTTQAASSFGRQLDIPETFTRKRSGTIGGGPVKSPLSSPRSIERLHASGIGDLKRMSLTRDDNTRDATLVSPLSASGADMKPMFDLNIGTSTPATLAHLQTLPGSTMAPMLQNTSINASRQQNNGLGHTFSQPITHTQQPAQAQAHPSVQTQLSAPSALHTDAILTGNLVRQNTSPLPSTLAQVPQSAPVPINSAGLHRVSVPSVNPTANVHQILVPRRGSTPYNATMAAKVHPPPPAVAGATTGPFMFNTPASRVDVNLSRKSRIKKASHNAIERKRRYNINDRIKELQEMLPAVALSRSKIKQCKGSTLKRSIDYIRYLENYNELMVQNMRESGISISMKSFAETEVEDTFADHTITEEKDHERDVQTTF
ncbi:hypothetical protein, variant 1, partial [Sphaeroforma arctica JP610]